jgi:hypothetical protein
VAEEVGVALCSEQARPRVALFVDEIGTHASLAPLYGYSPRGKPTFFKVPRNRGKNTTLLASIGCEGMGFMVVESSTSGKSSRPM